MEHDELTELAESLRLLLGEIDSGRMIASPTERARIEGAAVVVGVLAGGQPADLAGLLLDRD